MKKIAYLLAVGILGLSSFSIFATKAVKTVPITLKTQQGHIIHAQVKSSDLKKLKKGTTVQLIEWTTPSQAQNYLMESTWN